MLRITPSILASGMTTRWFLAPPIAWKRLLVLAHLSATMRATGVEPTNETPWTIGLSMIASATTESPLTTLKTPGGTPASSMCWVMACMVIGTCLDVLRTNVLPVAMA